MKKNQRTSILKTRSSKLSVVAPISEAVKSGYEKDFYKWTTDQVKHLQKGEYSKLDIEKLVEEIESLGNSERNAIESHMIILFIHLLKMDHQPSMRCKSWDNSIENAKFRIKRLTERNPSLKKTIVECLDDAYFSARLQASTETGLDTKSFPKKCPWKANELFPSIKLKSKI